MKLAILSAVAFALPATAALAGGHTITVDAGGSNNGFVGIALDAANNQTDSEALAGILTRTDTNPTYGASEAGMQLSAGGEGYDQDGYILGQALLDGDQQVNARVNRGGIKVTTTTDGLIDTEALAVGDQTFAGTLVYMSSEQTALAVDTSRHSYGGGEAQQLSVVGTYGSASGDDRSTVQVVNSTKSSSTVTVQRTR